MQWRRSVFRSRVGRPRLNGRVLKCPSQPMPHDTAPPSGPPVVVRVAGGGQTTASVPLCELACTLAKPAENRHLRASRSRFRRGEDLRVCRGVIRLVTRAWPRQRKRLSGVPETRKKPCRRTCRVSSIGSPSRTRTSDPVVNSHLLYRLSYRGSVRPGPSVGHPVRVVCGPGFYHRLARLSSFIFGRFQALFGSLRYAGILPGQDGRVGGRGRDRTADRGFAVPCITTLLPGHRVFTAGCRSDP